MPYFLSAINGRNPSYVSYLEKKGFSISQISEVFKTMKIRNTGIMFDKGVCDSIISEII